MENSSTDRNVLFGVLAWQLGVIEREPLMAAMYAWVTDKSRPLPDLLSERGLLNDADRQWVQQAVERQIAQHGADPARTLADLNVVDSVRHELLNIGLGATLAPDENAGTDVKLFSIDRHAPTMAQRVTLGGSSSGGRGEAAPPAPLRGSERFQIVRPHARGGLGEVFLAVDEELKREVALKQMLARHADNKASRARFLLEAEVTGNLEHPGVVPVYGLGTQPDGRPYYAMRFIRGESLDDAIRRFHEKDKLGDRDPGERALELRNLLTRFVAVCNTIEYAHVRGIVHRDLKPENIMLGPYGETLVVDWGLGRPMEQQEGEVGGEATTDEPALSTTSSGERPTLMGTVVGTPQFMSPEQASGRLDLIRAPSDVYSLGATLYCLLADQPPFLAADVRKVLKDVQAGKFLPPRQVKRDVPRGLEAVCLKAMALRPDDRYPSARKLADDIDHWLADEPVSAQEETSLERAARWMRRHKTWTQAAAAALVAVAAIAGIAYAREAGLRADREQALTLEAKARREADEARLSADHNAELAAQAQQRAESHARRAEQQSALALATLKSVLFDIQAKLKNVPAAQTVRLSMLNTVIDGLKQVARSLETAAETDHSLVRAHLDLGDIFLQVGVLDSSGATAEAQRQYERGAEVAEKLVAASPQNPAGRSDLAAAYQRLGDVGMQRGNLTTGAEWLQKSLDLRRTLADERKDDLDVRRDLAASIQRLGIVNQQLGNTTIAKDHYAQFLQISQELAEGDADNSENRRNLSVAYERMGDVALVQGDEKAAEDFFRKSLDVRRRLAAGAENNPLAERDMSVTLDRLGDLALNRGDVQAADDFFRQSLELRRKLFEADPNNIQAQRDLLVSYAQQGDAALQRNDVAGGLEFFHRYHEIAQKLAASDPENVQLQRDLATSFDRQGYALLRLGKAEEARDFYHRNYELLKRLAVADPSHTPILRDLATACATLGDLSLQLNDPTAARDYLAEYLAESRRRSEAQPGDKSATRALTDALLRNADVQLRLGDLATTDGYLKEAFQAAQKAALADPGDRAARIYLANAESMLAQYEVEMRNAESAALWAQSGIDDMLKAADGADADFAAQIGPWVKEQQVLLARCVIAQKASDDLEFALEQQAGLVPELLDFAAVAAIRKGRYDDALATIEKLAALEPANGKNLFLAARRAASTAGMILIKNGDGAAEMLRGRLIDRAVELLSEAHAARAFADPSTAARLEFADEMAIFKDRPQYQSLLDEVRRARPPAAASPKKSQ